MHPAALSVHELLSLCTIERTRRSGPGGQHRNKVETAVVITYRPSGMTAQASERRSQSENQSVAVFRLRVELAIQIRTDFDLTTGASELWRSRVRGTRIEINESHDDFPSILAESLDCLFQCEGRLTEAAELLGTTPSQLTKLWRKSPESLQLVNASRIKAGLRPLE